MKLGLLALKRLFTDRLRKPLTDGMFATLIDSLWRDPVDIVSAINNEIVNNTTNIYQSISQVIRTNTDFNHQSILIENTANASETVESSWSVLPYNQQCGEFKAVVMVRNKATDTIITLMSLLSFDYSDAVDVVLQTDLITDAALTLTLGVNGSNKLYATVSGMPTDNKRIHLCFERCVMSEREVLMEAAAEFALNMAAELSKYKLLGAAQSDFSLGMEAELSAYKNLSADFGLSLGMSAALTPFIDPDAFITEWNMTAGSFTLPLRSGFNYDMTVDWGDGSQSTVTSYDDADATHTYAAGTYQIQILGTCEAWYINANAAIRGKITKVIQWGNVGFTGLGLENAFWQAENLNELPDGPITGAAGITKFKGTFNGCTSLASIPETLFVNHTGITSEAFYNTFFGCQSLATIPTELFRYNTAVTSYAFFGTFGSCYALTAIPTDLFRYNTAVTSYGFMSTFTNCIGVTVIPTDLFRYNTLVSTQAFSQCFQGCTNLTTVPVDLFRYNTLAGYRCFDSLFHSCTSLVTVPDDLFRYNTAVSGYGFANTFYGCSNLATVPNNLFKYNTSCTTFRFCFYGCVKLQVNRNIFYADGEQSTRFLNQSIDFQGCFTRASFSGTQGEAPDLWNCSFGTGTPVKTSVYSGAGNSGTSLSNYADIPADWK